MGSLEPSFNSTISAVLSKHYSASIEGFLVFKLIQNGLTLLVSILVMLVSSTSLIWAVLAFSAGNALLSIWYA